MAKPFSSKRTVDERSRLQVAQACAHSRLLYHAGCWPCLGRAQMAKFAKAHYKQLRAIGGAHRPPPPGDMHVANLAVGLHLRVVPPVVVVSGWRAWPLTDGLCRS